MTRVALLDHGAGNILSIRQALAAIGADVVLAERPDDVDGAALVVVPGVGASAPAMRRLRRTGLDAALRRALDGGAWYLGICLGLQLLFERSDEDGARMLGLLPGRVVAIPEAPRLPHIGWNAVEPVRDHPLVAGLPAEASAYFVHSYVCLPDDPTAVVAETEHGTRFPSILASGRLMGMQFHPERSGRDGLRILADAVALASAGRGARRVA